MQSQGCSDSQKGESDRAELPIEVGDGSLCQRESCHQERKAKQGAVDDDTLLQGV